MVSSCAQIIRITKLFLPRSVILPPTYYCNEASNAASSGSDMSHAAEQAAQSHAAQSHTTSSGAPNATIVGPFAGSDGSDQISAAGTLLHCAVLIVGGG